MAQKAGTLRSRLLGQDQPTKKRMVEALESRLEETEDLEYQLTSDGSLTHEEDDGDTYEKGGGDGGTLLAVTDRKLVFVVDTRSGLETADVPYTDLKDITADTGILQTSLSVTVWGRGTYSFEPSDKDKTERVAEFATKGSHSWQRVVAALQDARQHISTIDSFVERGRMDDARGARWSARSNLETASNRIDDAPRWFRDPLTERYERVEAELTRTWMDARFERGRDLLPEGTGFTNACEYDAACDRFQRAREHLETALTMAVEGGFDLAGDAQSALADLRDRRQRLAARPLELAEQSRRAAQAADSPEKAVSSWEAALSHYRDVLEAGWGTDIDFDGDDDAVRMQIEWVVANIARQRHVLAASLEAEGDEHSSSGNRRQARDRYEAAADQIEMARRLASQYRAGDADSLSTRLARLHQKRDDHAA